MLTVRPKFSINATSLFLNTASNHPNAVPFSGILLRLNEPSDAPPQGSDGHRIIMSTEAAEAALPSIIGMGVNFRIDGHDQAHKIGVITGADIEGNAVKIHGILYGKDFPDKVREIKSNAKNLGFSMELADVSVDDSPDYPDVWDLQSFHFTGAAILGKKAAAYHKTAIAASRASKDKKRTGQTQIAATTTAATPNREATMPNNKRKVAAKAKPTTGQALISAMAAAVGAAVRGPLSEISSKLDELNQNINAKIQPSPSSPSDLKDPSDAVSAAKSSSSNPSSPSPSNPSVDAASDAANAVDELLNAMTPSSPSMSPSSPSMAGKAKKVKAAKSSSDPSAGECFESGLVDPSGDEDYLDANAAEPSDAHGAGADPSDEDAEPGKVNKNADVKFEKHSRAHLKATRDMQAAAQKAKRKVADLQAAFERERNEKTELQKTIEKMEAQIAVATEKLDRRTLPGHMANLLAKGGVDVSELRQNGQKLSVNDVDSLLASSGTNLDATFKAHFKNVLVQQGLMDEGYVRAN